MNLPLTIFALSVISFIRATTNPNVINQPDIDRSASLNGEAPFVPGSAEEIVNTFVSNLTDALSIYLSLKEDLDALHKFIDHLSKKDVLIEQLAEKRNQFKNAINISFEGYTLIKRLLYRINRTRLPAFNIAYNQFLISLNYSRMVYDLILTGVEDSSGRDGHIKNSVRVKEKIINTADLGYDGLHAYLSTAIHACDGLIATLTVLKEITFKEKKGIELEGYNGLGMI